MNQSDVKEIIDKGIPLISENYIVSLVDFAMFYFRQYEAEVHFRD